MEKRKRVVINFFMENGRPKAQNQNKIIEAKDALEFLEKCRKDREIKKGKIIKRGDYVEYSYDLDVFYRDIRKYSYVIRIKNSERNLYYETTKYLESLCDLSVTLNKLNVARLTAGIIAGMFVLVNAGPHIVKGLEKRNDIKNLHQQELYQEIENKINTTGVYYPTEEEKQDAEQWYYENIENKEENETMGKIK